jgi:hypothetical protein
VFADPGKTNEKELNNDYFGQAAVRDVPARKFQPGKPEKTGEKHFKGFPSEK